MAKDTKQQTRDEDLPGKEQLGAQALPPITDVKASDRVGGGDKAAEAKGPLDLALRGDYRPREGVHLAEAGEVVLDNWTGKIDGKRVNVNRGTHVDDLPPNVRKALDGAGIKTGQITYEELGLRQPGQGPGAQILGVKREG